MAEAELDERGRALDRVINFSDGVFAIAITLLVLNFKLPHVGGRSVNRKLLDALGHDTGLLFGFAISFFVIARYWMSHHRLSVLLRRVDTQFIVLNLVFLAFVVFIPFPAEVLGTYSATTTAVVFYAGTMVLTGTLSGTTWEYALRRGLDDGRASVEARREALLRSAILVAVFLASIPVAFIDAGVAQLMWLLLLVQRPFARRLSRAAPGPRTRR